MKIALNLATSQSARERYALVWTAPVTLGAGVCLIYLLVFAAHNIREYSKLHQWVTKYQTQLNIFRDKEKAARRNLEQPQYREVVREARFVNTLIDQKQLSLTELTAKVTKLLPPQVRLTGLSLSEPTGEPLVRLDVEGSQEAVENFVSHLEESPDFSDPTITQQGFEQKSSAGAPGKLEAVTCTARYASGVRSPESGVVAQTFRSAVLPEQNPEGKKRKVEGKGQ